MKQNRRLVFNGIIESIAKGDIQRGKKLPSENALAQRLGVKRSDVRDALVALELLGFIESRQGQGSYLVDFELTEPSNPFALMVMLQKGKPQEIMHIRTLIETEAARLCASHRAPRDISELRDCFNSLGGLRGYREHAMMDARFHSIIAKGCGNKLLQTMIHFVYGYISYVSLNNWIILLRPDHEEQRNAIIDQHRSILGAIQNGLPDEAAQAMRAHLNFITGNLNHRIKEDYDAYEKQTSILWA